MYTSKIEAIWKFANSNALDDPDDTNAWDEETEEEVDANNNNEEEEIESSNLTENQTFITNTDMNEDIE